MSFIRITTILTQSFRCLIGPILSLILISTFILTYPIVIASRSLILIYIKLFVPNSGRILTPLDMLMYENTKGSVHNSLVVVVELENPVRSSDIVNVLSRVVTVYPELTMTVRVVFGVKVLTKVHEFILEDHVNEIHGVFDLASIHEELLSRTYAPGTSPWEVCLFNKRSVLGFRVHHILADGLSLLKLVVEGVGSKKLECQGSKGFGVGAKKWVNTLFGVGVDYLEWGLGVFGKQRFWVGDSGGGNVFVGGLKLFGDVRRVCRNVGVCGSGVIVAGILGGLSKYLKYSQDKVDSMRVGYVLPVSGHPGGVCNHWRISCIKLKLHEFSGPVTLDSLKAFNKMFVNLKSSSLCVFYKYSILWGGACFGGVDEFFLKNRYIGVGITNIAGDNEGFSVCGSKCTGFSLSSRGLKGVGLMFCVVSYRQGFRVIVVGDSGVLGKEEVRQISGFIDKEFGEVIGFGGGDEIGDCCV